MQGQKEDGVNFKIIYSITPIRGNSRINTRMDITKQIAKL